MKTLSLRPYPGEVRVFKSVKAYHKAHLKLFGEPDKDLSGNQGRMTGIWNDKLKRRVYLVWATTPTFLAHELSHVILDLFDDVGIDPREANGEPFCYMLSQLLLECES